MSIQADWPRLKTLFAQALDLPESERGPWISNACADDPATLDELRSLLAASGSQSGFLSGAGRFLPMFAGEAAGSSGPEPGTRIGPYRVLRVIGSGGMASVFLAERADGQFSQEVALKLIRSELSSADLQRRFVRERETLARLVHPNIATLHDGGLTDEGAPYFTMELVDGEPITRWSDAHRSDIRARVELMIEVCDAVQYAHSNLVVHRDIKPSNILVTAMGQPKLLDFGIAKPIAGTDAELTGTEMQPMTREYAAPEQVTGDPITTATDVYALGMLMYLLFSGRMPYVQAERGQIGWIKAILDETPEPLARAVERTQVSRDTSNAGGASSAPPTADAETIAAARSTSLPALKRALRGDLDRIVQRALAKSPDARYATVSAMADDLRAYLAGRALSGGTRTYRLRKFVRRHWLPLAAAALLLIAIVGGAALMLADARQIEREAETTRAVKTFLLDLFRNANPAFTEGKQVSLRDVVDLGVARLDAIPADQSEMKAELQNLLGTVYYQLNVHEEALRLHNQAFESAKANPATRTLAIISERAAATDSSAMSDNVRAQALDDDAIKRARALGADGTLELARSLDTGVWIATKRRDAARIAEYSKETIALSARNPDDAEIAFFALSQRAATARAAHDDDAAIEWLQKALPAALKTFGPNGQETQKTQYQLGNELLSVARYGDALAPLQAALESSRKVFGETHPRTLRTEQLLAVDESESGHVAEGLHHFSHMLASAEKTVPHDESVIAELRLNVASVLLDLARPDEAEPLLVQVRDFLQSRQGAEPSELENTLFNLGYAHLLQGRIESAESEAREGIAVMAAAHSDDVSSAYALLSEALLLRRDIDGAVVAGREARDSAIKVDGERSYDAAWAHTCYGKALAAAGQSAEAETEFRTALKTYADLTPAPAEHPQSSHARLALGALLVARSDGVKEGQRLMQEAVATREKFFGADNPQSREAREILLKASH